LNLRNVLRTYSLLRQLSDDESALLETLRAMNDAERELLVQSLQPEKVTTKKAGKKPSKSQRASGMAAAIRKSLESQKRVTEPICGTCGNVEDYADHSQPSPHYHPFQPPAPAAATPSSTNGGERSTTVSIVEQTASAQSAAGGSSERT
jgi:hypothetical protein